jgi:hypothetical protein
MEVQPAMTHAADRELESDRTTARRTFAPNSGAADEDPTGFTGEVHERSFGSVLGEHEAIEQCEERERVGREVGVLGTVSLGCTARDLGAIISPAPAAARAILNFADLERIVSVVRTQLLSGARHEVTIELRRSVLEGLQVKLRSGADGRITAEFIVSSARVRSQLDARAAELAELLRGRGVSLASLRTSVDSGGGASGDEGGAERGGRPQTFDGVRSATPGASDVAEPGGETTNTYRA